MVNGTIFDISRYSIRDGPGIRSTVFFKGCPLSCAWCHNPESLSRQLQISYNPGRCILCEACIRACPSAAISLIDGAVTTDASLCKSCMACADACSATAREAAGRTVSVGDVMAQIRKDIPFYDESGGGVTFSGGEPLMQPAFLMELLEECGRHGLHRAVDTSGYAPRDLLLAIAGQTDLFLYDIKHMDSRIHREYTGVDNERILANLRSLSARHDSICIRFPVIPGVNDDSGNVEGTAAFLRSLGNISHIDLLPYHASADAKYRRFALPYRAQAIPVPEPEQLQSIAVRLSGCGFQVTIGGQPYERAC